MKSAAWYAIAIKQPLRASSEKGPVAGAFVVRKTRDPRIKGGRYAFGPYRTKKKACEVGCYQNYARVPQGCPVSACAHPTFSGARRRRRKR